MAAREFLDQGRAILQEVLEDVVHTIAFYRNETDSFALDILPVDPAAKPLSASCISSVLPKGSRWRSVVGWRCFRCVPLASKAGRFFCVGLEGVIAHAERGAFPEYYGFLVRNVRALPTPLMQMANRIYHDKLIDVPSHANRLQITELPMNIYH
jgi:hypothetical protein